MGVPLDRTAPLGVADSTLLYERLTSLTRAAVIVTAAAMPLYIIRFKVGPIPTTLLEILILSTIAIYAVAVLAARAPLPSRAAGHLPRVSRRAGRALLRRDRRFSRHGLIQAVARVSRRRFDPLLGRRPCVLPGGGAQRTDRARSRGRGVLAQPELRRHVPRATDRRGHWFRPLWKWAPARTRRGRAAGHAACGDRHLLAGRPGGAGAA